ncbi:MAG: mechanosensitive ion channel [Hyphomicrobiaceae bacterium]
MTELAQSSWFQWGLLLLLLFPMCVVGLNELSRVSRTGTLAAYSASIGMLRAAVLPLLFVTLMLRFVAGYDGQHLAVRIADTAFWIVLINFSLGVLNAAFFGDGDRAGLTTRVPKLLLDLIRLFLVLVATSIVVSVVWGVDLGSLLTALGVGSLVIGLALQDTLGSVFSGLAMLSTRQFRVGDYISVGDQEGILTSMNWRTVTIRNLLGDDVVIPNSAVSGEKVTVVGANSGRRTMEAEVQIAFDHPPERVVQLMLETARHTTGILAEPAPVAWISGFNEFAVRYTLWFTAADVARAYFTRHEFYSNFWYACQRHNIVFPAQYHVDFNVPADRRVDHNPSGEILARMVAEAGALPKTESELIPLMQHASKRIYREGEIIAAKGTHARDALIVISGQAQAHYSPEPDRTLKACDFGPGQIVLFKSAFRSGEVPHDVVAGSEVTAVALPLSALKVFLATDLTLAREIERSLSAREAFIAKSIQQTFPGRIEADGVHDRVSYLKEMFRT